MQKYRAKRN